MSDERDNADEWKPRPDPTRLTTDQLRRELGALNEKLGTRLDAMDKATSLLQENQTRVPTEIDKQIMHLKELHDEKFKRVDVQFTDRDVALQAALSAAKEAVEKQTQWFAESIRESKTATGTQLSSLDGKIEDLKDRITRGEGRNSGAKETVLETRSASAQNWGFVVGGIGIFFGLVGFLGAIFSLIHGTPMHLGS